MSMRDLLLRDLADRLLFVSRVLAIGAWVYVAIQIAGLIAPVRRLIHESTAAWAADRRLSEQQLKEGR